MPRRRATEDSTSRRTRQRQEKEVHSVEGQAFATSGPLAIFPWSPIGQIIVRFIALSAEVGVQRPDGLNTQDFHKQLVPMQLVCRHWNQLVLSMVTSYDSQIHNIEWSGANTQSSRSHPQSTTENHPVLQLQFTVLFPSDPPMTPRSLRPSNRLRRIHWFSEFSVFPSIVRLDLVNICLSQVAQALDAASTNCPNIQYLVLPKTILSPSVGMVRYESITVPLVAALRAWHNSNGGLRGLRVPYWPGNLHGEYNELLMAVATYCPQLEYLHGWYKQRAWSVTELARSGDEAWEAFCTNCTQLREFSWRMSVLSSRFVDIFRQTPKTLLKDLYIDNYFPTTIPADISCVLSLFPAVPGLVNVSLWMPGYGGLPSSRPLTGTLDDLIESVRINCPRLEKFCCFFPRSLDPTAVASGESLVPLIRQSTMREVVISPVVLAGDCLVQMLEAVVTSSKRRYCKVELMTIGNVHDAIHHFVEFLVEGRIDLTGIRLKLHVRTPDHQAHGDGTKEAATNTHIRKAAMRTRMARINARYLERKIQVHVTTSKLDGRNLHVYSGLQLSVNTPL